MLLPVLPADVHPLILEQLVEPISVDRFPPHYKHPRAASLVCKDWAKTAQKLLYEHVYLVVEEDRVSNFHAGKPMTDWTIQDLALQAADPEGIDLNHEYLIDSVVDIVGREALPSLKLVDIFAVPLLLPLAANLTTLQLPLYRHKPPLTDLGVWQSEESNRFLREHFLPACTSLRHLILPCILAPTYLERVPPTCTRFTLVEITWRWLSTLRRFLSPPKTLVHH